MKLRNLTNNILIVLIYRILLVLFLFSLCRIGFYFFNLNMFPDISLGQFLIMMKGGLLFDISAAVYINMPFILLEVIPFDFRYNRIYEQILRVLFFVTNGIAIAANCMDFVYYRFVFKRATADVFKTFENEEHMSKMFFKFLADYWPATILCFFIWFLMVFLYNKVKPVKPEPKSKITYYLINVLFIPVALALVIGGARGGYRHSTRPITISNAARYVKSPHDVPIVLNTPFSILRTYCPRYNKAIHKR